MPVILVTSEAEIRKIVAQGQLRQNSLYNPISKNNQSKTELEVWLKW
jgi:hypothetical protein